MGTNGIELYIYTHTKIHTLRSQLAQDFSHQRCEKTAIDENEEYVTNYCPLQQRMWRLRNLALAGSIKSIGYGCVF